MDLAQVLGSNYRGIYPVDWEFEWYYAIVVVTFHDIDETYCEFEEVWWNTYCACFTASVNTQMLSVVWRNI